MKLKLFLPCKRPLAAAPQPVASKPQALDARDLTKVAGGLPRTGTWAATSTTVTAVDASAQLPRTGTW